MKHLIIIGAGGYGRETYALALGSLGYGVDFDVRGFLDARADALAGAAGYPPIVGSPEEYVPEPDDVFISALGDIVSRRRCVAAVASRGGRFVSLVHRSATLGTNVVVGEGTLVAPNAFVSADARIGRHAAVFHGASVGHDAVLGDFSHVYAQCSIGGEVRIGSGAVVYPGAVVTPRRTVGDGAVVGAGSTVILNVKDGETVFGSPARPVK